MGIPWVIVICLLCWYLGREAERHRRDVIHARGNQLDLALKNQLVSGSLGNTRRPTPPRGLGAVDAAPFPNTQRPVSEVPAPGLYVVRDEKGSAS